MKPLLIGIVVAVIAGVVLAIYVSLTTFFAANAKALRAVQKQSETLKSAENDDAIKKKQAHAG